VFKTLYFYCILLVLLTVPYFIIYITETATYESFGKNEKS